MEPTIKSRLGQQEVSRRRFIRKAAYTAPVVFAVAAAPKSALGKSGTVKPPKPPKK
jgi:hypothetical protein